jgi:CheY-like chemotaxis protein
MCKTILYVDDEPWFVDALVDALKDEGYEVEQAEDGSQAIDMLERHKEHGSIPDLIVMDVIMPTGARLPESDGGRRTGLKVHETIRKNLKLKVPIIFVTVVDDAKTEREIDAVEKYSGTRNYALLIKPVLPTELLEKVSAMLTS